MHINSIQFNNCRRTITGKSRSTQWKTCPSATLSTKNPSRTDLGLRIEAGD